MSEMPGPDVDVIDRAPAQPAPSAIPTDASSSSAWTTAKVAFPVSWSLRYFLKYSINVSTTDEDGVIGYQVTTVTPAIIAPIAMAALASMRTFPPLLFIRSARHGSRLGRFCSA